MRFISNLCWVKKGVSQTPTRIKLDKSEMKQLFSELDNPNISGDENEVENENEEDTNEEETTSKHNNKEDSEDEKTRKINKKYNMDDYDDEDEELRLDQLNSLACFASNLEDKLLDPKNINSDDSDQEDIEIKKSDNLIVCGTLEDMDSSLNIFVYNDEESSFYIHHDILLSSIPICLEWLDFDPTAKDTPVNYMAVGTLNPWIEIWDLDLMDSLEPEFILGSNVEMKKKKKKLKTDEKLKKKHKIVGHTKPVLDMSHNKLNRGVMASGSADKSIVLWDLEKLQQATKIKNHTAKVQSIKFHPIESFSLLSGSADQTVVLYDCRNPKVNNKKWSFSGEIEQVLWNHQEPNHFICSDDGGSVHICDIRNDAPLLSKKVSDSAITGITLSSSVPGLFMTASENEYVRIWDIQNNEMELIHEKKLKLGSLNSARSSPDSGFVFTFGGTQSSYPEVWDIREIDAVREKFYSRMNLTDVVESDTPKVNKRKERAERFKKWKVQSEKRHGAVSNKRNKS